MSGYLCPCPALMCHFRYEGDECAEYVVNDFGDMVVSERHGARQQFAQSHLQFLEDSASDWLLAENERIDSLYRASQLPHRVSAEIGEPEQDWAGRSCTQIVISQDEAWQRAPHFELRVIGSGDPVTLTQAQLAALLVAAESLCRPARRVRRNSSAPGVTA